MAVAGAVVWLTGQVILPVTKGVPRSGAQMGGEISLASGTAVDSAGKWRQLLTVPILNIRDV